MNTYRKGFRSSENRFVDQNLGSLVNGCHISTFSSLVVGKTPKIALTVIFLVAKIVSFG
jgi:hypothetical protein